MKHKHHPTLPPSSAGQILLCPCYKSGKPGQAAERGTKQHEAYEQILTGAPERDKCLSLTPEEIESVVWAARQTMDLAKGREILLERRVSLVDDDLNEITFGRVDAHCAPTEEEPLFLDDYKGGEPHDVYWVQMSLYALGLMDRYRVDSCVARLLYGRRFKVEQKVLTRFVCQTVLDRLIAQVNKETKEPVANDYCHWCVKHTSCPAVNGLALEVARGREDWQLANYHSSEITDPKEMSKALFLSRLLKKWCESVEHHAREMLMKGVTVPGFSLCKRSGRKQVDNLPAAFAFSGLPQEAFLACCQLNFGKLEAAYANAFDISLYKSRKVLKEKLGSLMVSSPETVYIRKAKEK